MDLLKSDSEWEEELGPYVTIGCGASSPEIAGKFGVRGAEDLELGQAGEEKGGIPGPATLWGILLSETSTRALKDKFSVLPESEVLDRNAIKNIWTSAGYDCQLLVEDAAASPAVTDTTVINEESIQYHQPPDPIGPYIVKEALGKGQGVFTTRDVVKGERVLVDKPFFLVTKPYEDRKVLREFERMSLARRQQYMRFCCPNRRDNIHLTDVMCIFEGNCFNIGDRAAIFLTATRFNHSCLPNTYYSWSEKRGEIVFHTMIDIPEGEELTISYGHPFCTSLKRQFELRIYNFCCDCPACQIDTAFGQASESRRLAMKALNEEIFMFQSSFNEALLLYLRDPLTAIFQLIETIKEEGLHGQLMTRYRNAADYLKARGNFEAALNFARLELEEEVICLGDDSEVVHKTIEYIEELEKEVEEVREEGDQEHEDDAEGEEFGWQAEKASGKESTDSEAGSQEPEQILGGKASELEPEKEKPRESDEDTQALEKRPVSEPNTSDMAAVVKLEKQPAKEVRDVVKVHEAHEVQEVHDDSGFCEGCSNDPQIDSRSSSPRLLRKT